MMEVLKEGQVRIDMLVSACLTLFEGNISLFDLESTFKQLLRVGLLRVSRDLRRASVSEHSSEATTAIDVSEETVTELFRRAASVKEEASERPTRRVRRSSSTEDGSSVYFQVDYAKADQMLRDELLIKSLKNRFLDENVAVVAESLVRLSSKLPQPTCATSSSVALESLVRDVSGKGVSEMEVKSCLDVLTEASDCGIRAVERLAGGGIFHLDILTTLTRITEAMIAMVVEQKFGSRCARVWRIVLSEKGLPQKLVEEKALMPPKDCKEIMFTLVREGFVRTDYYSRTVDFAPAKTHFLFSVDLEQVVRRVIGHCCHAIACAITRRNHEYDSNRLLIERKAHVDQQVSLLSLEEDAQQQIEDLLATFTSRDLELVGSAENAFRKLQLAELQVEEMLFVLQSWLRLKLTSEAVKA